MTESVTVEQAEAPPQVTHAAREGTTLSEYMESLLVTVILALFGTSFVVQAFKIPSSSMERTLLIGDHLLVNKFIFGGTGAWYEKLLPYRPLRRGDIIVFKYPYADHQHFVKRVIGLPGDHLKIVDQQVYINGKLLNEPYVEHDPAAGYDPLNYAFPPVGNPLYSSPVEPEWARDIKKSVQGDEIVVPPGKYFAMGDNRDHSLDSRYWGFVPRKNILGSPLFIAWSLNQTEADFPQDATLLERAKSFVTTAFHFFGLTRWNRVMRLVH